MTQRIKVSFLSIFIAVIAVCAGVVGPMSASAQTIDPCGLERASSSFEFSPELKSCADEGNPEAKAWLGMLYWSASIGGPDEAELKDLTLPSGTSAEDLQSLGHGLLLGAANSGSALAMNEIGAAHFYATYGFKQDYEKARDWLLKAYQAGDQIAPITLAQIHAYGLGVHANAEEAEFYLRESAARGYDKAQCALRSWERETRRIGHSPPLGDYVSDSFPCADEDAYSDSQFFIVAACVFSGPLHLTYACLSGF
ncbi:MAG: hypothetical protein CMK06_07445 [Ponticaulis sp.]|nr:hypothetical protein [Ponticaulis sp.]